MGDEATKTYKYTSNKDSRDGTEEIRLPGHEPVRQGEEIDLTDAEHELLKERLNLREVGSEDSKSGQGSSATQESARADSAK